MVSITWYWRWQKQKEEIQKYPIGYCHIDIAEVATEEGKLRLFVAIDRTCKFAYVELYDKFLRNLITAIPYKIHTIVTDNGIQFINRKQYQYHDTSHNQLKEYMHCFINSYLFVKRLKTYSLWKYHAILEK